MKKRIDGAPLTKHNYKRLKELKIPVRQHPGTDTVVYVKVEDIKTALIPRGMLDRFHEMFGVQTVCDLGPYPWDVEAVLERLMSGRRTGTQFILD